MIFTFKKSMDLYIESNSEGPGLIAFKAFNSYLQNFTAEVSLDRLYLCLNLHAQPNILYQQYFCHTQIINRSLLHK